MADTAQDLEYRLATGNQIAWESKVDLRLVISEEEHPRDLGMTCYIETGL